MGNTKRKQPVILNYNEKEKNFKYLVTLENKRKFNILKEIIGIGSTSIVRFAQDTKNKKLYAVKIINKEIIKKDESNIEQEIECMNKLNNPNIMSLEEVAEFPDSFFLFMEYCEGGNLKKYLKEKGNLSLIELLKIIQDILRAMKNLNDNQIIHRDLKPENILVKGENFIISDFGIARVLDQSSDLDPKLSFKGVSKYASPQIIGEGLCGKYTNKCDIWSLGILFYGILYGGSHPVFGKNVEEIINPKTYLTLLENKFLKQNFEILIEIPQRPKKLKILIQDMLQFNEDKRLSFLEVFDKFEEIIKESDSSYKEASPIHEKGGEVKKIEENRDMLLEVPLFESQMLIKSQNIKIPKPLLLLQCPEEDFNLTVKKNEQHRKNENFLKIYLERKRDFGQHYLECVFMIRFGRQHNLIIVSKVVLIFITILLFQKAKRFFMDFKEELLLPEGIQVLKKCPEKEVLQSLPAYQGMVKLCDSKIKLIEDWIQVVKIEYENELNTNEKGDEKYKLCCSFTEREAYEDAHIEKGLLLGINWFIKENASPIEDLNLGSRKYFNCIINTPCLQETHSFPAEMNIYLIPNILLIRETLESEDSDEIAKRVNQLKLRNIKPEEIFI